MIVKGKLHWILGSLILGIVFTLASVNFRSYIIYVLANVFFFVAVVLIVLFRNPPRRIGAGLVSPADGKVVHVDEGANTLTIKTGILSEHIIRAPISGRVLDVRRIRKKHPTSPNERKGVEIRIATSMGVVRIFKSSSLSLLGVSTLIWPEMILRKGQEIGTVTPTALVTVELPEAVEMLARKGQKVRGGETTIGKAFHTRLLVKR